MTVSPSSTTGSTIGSTTVLLRNGVVHTHSPLAGTAIAIRDGLVVFVGDEDQAEAYAQAEEVVDLRGALVAPAFVDAHVHTVQSGFQLTQLDLRGARSLAEALEAVASYAVANGPDTVLIGAGWDESTWPEGRPPTADELERAAPGRRISLDRRDGHSSVISSDLAAAVPGLLSMDGYSASGRIERDARHAVSNALASLVGPDQRLEAARRAVAEMATNGVAAFHENAAPHIGPEYEVDLVRQAAAETGLLPTLYWGELGAIDKVVALGVQGLAGDLNADGAIGSRTAALRTAYDDMAGHCGHAYLEADQIAEHVILCTEAGLQAGFHCIGDAAIDAITEGFRTAEKRLGAPAIRQGRHRLEHVEMPSPDAVAMMADLNVTASMQPLFDHLWGGPDRMYAERLGGRWRGMNPVAGMGHAGVRIAFGSDAPVTDVRPWEAVRAAVHHRDPEQRIGAALAFDHHTSGGWRAARNDVAGTLTPGAPAHLAVWDCPGGLEGREGREGPSGMILPILDPAVPLPQIHRLVVAGRTVADHTIDGEGP
jgi:predicted amidohydrolase YtcJ